MLTHFFAKATLHVRGPFCRSMMTYPLQVLQADEAQTDSREKNLKDLVLPFRRVSMLQFLTVSGELRQTLRNNLTAM